MNNEQKATATPATTPGNRSEGLLPADDDRNLEVAEEVSLDLQSDGTRAVGAAPSDTPVSKPAEAMAQALAPTGAAGNSEPSNAGPEPAPNPVQSAIERAVPPSV